MLKILNIQSIYKLGILFTIGMLWGTCSYSNPDSTATPSPSSPPTEVVKIIDPDNGPGTDYTSLEGFAVREKRDLVAANEIAVAVCRSSNGSPDRPAQFDHWVTDRQRYVRVVADSAHRAGPRWDDTKYRIIETSTGNSESIDIEIDNIEIDGIQMMLKGSGRSHDIIDPEEGDFFVIKNCYLRIELTSGAGDAIDLKSPALMINNIIECKVEEGRLSGIIAMASAEVVAYNNTIIGFYYGFRSKDNARIIAVNNIVRGAADGFSASDHGILSEACDYNSSNVPGDALVKAPRDSSQIPWFSGDLPDSLIFIDPANHDFRLRPDSPFWNAGIGPAIDPAVPAINMSGEIRSGDAVNLGAD